MKPHSKTQVSTRSDPRDDHRSNYPIPASFTTRVRRDLAPSPDRCDRPDPRSGSRFEVVLPHQDLLEEGQLLCEPARRAKLGHGQRPNRAWWGPPRSAGSWTETQPSLVGLKGSRWPEEGCGRCFAERGRRIDGRSIVLAFWICHLAPRPRSDAPADGSSPLGMALDGPPGLDTRCCRSNPMAGA